MKKYLQTSIILLAIGFSSCCDFICERHKYAESIIEKVEAFNAIHHRLPNDVTEIGLPESFKAPDTEPPAYYSKTSDSTYSVSYAIGFESNVYRSQTKKWREEG